jgi:hypothetical protein
MGSWTKAQWEAFGRHIITALAATVATLVAVNLVKAEDAAALVNSATALITAVVGLASIVVPIISGFYASKSASPEHQAAQTVKNLTEGVALNGKRDQLIEAVANQPDVKSVEMQDPAKAQAISSNKVK